MTEKAATILKKLASPGRPRTSNASSSVLARSVIEAIQAKKAKKIVLIDMREVSEIADYFVICTGESDLQIKAVVDGVEEHVRESVDERPWRTEGYDARQWVVIDYVDVVVHVFDQKRRSYYNLERLWADAPSEQIDEEATVDVDDRPGN